MSGTLQQLMQSLKVDVTLSEVEWQKIISPEDFIEIRSLKEGPSPKEVEGMIGVRKECLGRNFEEYNNIVRTLNDKREKLVNFTLYRGESVLMFQ